MTVILSDIADLRADVNTLRPWVGARLVTESDLVRLTGALLADSPLAARLSDQGLISVVLTE